MAARICDTARCPEALRGTGRNREFLPKSVFEGLARMGHGVV